MSVECPDCRDKSRYITDPYKPYCIIAQREISRGEFEFYCKSYSAYRKCPIRRKYFGD
ncbi:MAG: hypothetical protein Q4B54_13410 [Coriobacteriales bacterium]|nr:hypothetical protein [Coriobacteriales bacterium]